MVFLNLSIRNFVDGAEGSRIIEDFQSRNRSESHSQKQPATIESLIDGIKMQMCKIRMLLISKKIQTHCDLFFEEESFLSQHQVY